MADVIKKIDTGKDIKNGFYAVKTGATSTTQIKSGKEKPNIVDRTPAQIEAKLQSRFDDPTYYG